MRELTFRTWYPPTSKFYYFHLTEIIGLVRTIAIPENSIIQQYTGVKDKNGREIYEGDLVNFEYEFGPGDWEKEINQEVFFEEGIFYFGRDLKFATNDCNFNKKSLEVIGNIFNAYSK